MNELQRLAFENLWDTPERADGRPRVPPMAVFDAVVGQRKLRVAVGLSLNK